MTSKHINRVIKDRKWEWIKPYILLRKLVDDKRAAPITTLHNCKHADCVLEVDANIETEADAETEAVVQNLFINMSLDIFRYVLLYVRRV